MSIDDPVGIIELGNINLKCLIFKINKKNETELLSTSASPSKGIHNGSIINLTKASDAIRFCLSTAEKEAKILLKKINVVLEEPEFLCTKFSKHKKIHGSKIHKDDIEFLLNEAKKQLLLNDNNQSIVHIFNHNYIVDGKNFLEAPIGIHADFLSHEMTFITLPKNNVKNLNQVFTDCDIEIERLISNTFALGANLLSTKELEYGSIIIDFGFEKTSLGIFKNFALVHSMTIPIGINHITKDISKVCSLSLMESESIKDNINFLFQNDQNIVDLNGYLKQNYFVNSKFRKISKELILNIIKDRTDEIFKKIKKEINLAKFSISAGSNILITGIGSRTMNIEKYLSTFFGLSVKKIENNSEQNKNESIQIFNSCFGALKIIKDGWETEAIPQSENKSPEKMGFFAKIFRIH